MVMTRDNLVQKLIKYASDDFTEDQMPFVEDCVDSAISEVCNRMYPWGIANDRLYESVSRKALARYAWVINRVAQYHYDKQGKQGVTTFYEAGQTTSFESGGTPESFFNDIVPIAKVV